MPNKRRVEIVRVSGEGGKRSYAALDKDDSQIEARGNAVIANIHPPTPTQVFASDITRAPEYNRKINRNKVAEIVRRYNKTALGRIRVSRRTNGQLVIIDGQHRWEASKIAEGDMAILDADVYEELSPQEEADLFLFWNRDSTRPNVPETFRAARFAGESEAIIIDGLVRKHHMKVGVGEGEESYGRNTIFAVGVLQQIYRQGGERLLDDVLEVNWEVYGKHGTGPGEAGYRAYMEVWMRALARFLRIYQPVLERERLIAKLTEKPVEWFEQIAARENPLAGSGQSKATSVANAILRHYNAGLGASRRRLDPAARMPKSISSPREVSRAMITHIGSPFDLQAAGGGRD